MGNCRIIPVKLIEPIIVASHPGVSILVPGEIAYITPEPNSLFHHTVPDVGQFGGAADKNVVSILPAMTQKPFYIHSKMNWGFSVDEYVSVFRPSAGI